MAKKACCPAPVKAVANGWTPTDAPEWFASGSNWKVRCVCRCGHVGYPVVRADGILRSSRCNACVGVMRRGIPSGVIARQTHGQSVRNITYFSWLHMKARCNPEARTPRKDYVGRGIVVCERWAHSFENFRADMGDRPDKRFTLDRIDNAGNYEPANCRWSTWTEQLRNKRSNVVLTHAGESKTLTEWAESLGLSFNTLRNRVKQYGWSVERALTEPARVYTRRHGKVQQHREGDAGA